MMDFYSVQIAASPQVRGVHDDHLLFPFTSLWFTGGDGGSYLVFIFDEVALRDLRSADSSILPMILIGNRVLREEDGYGLFLMFCEESRDLRSMGLRNFELFCWRVETKRRRNAKHQELLTVKQIIGAGARRSISIRWFRPYGSEDGELDSFY